MAESSREEIAKLEALYANNPEGRVFTHLAEALRKAGELDRARTILQDGLAKHATYASAHVVLGRVLMDQQQPDEAAESFRRVITLDPHNLVALRSLGDIARSAGRAEEAIGYFEQLKHHDPVNEEIDSIIAELSARPAPAVEGPQAVQEASGDGEAHAALGAYAPPPSVLGAEPAFAAAPAAEPEPVSQEIDLDWVGDLDSDTEDGLPGDLGTLAGMASSGAEPQQAEPELPTFAMPDNVGEIGSLDTGFGDEEQAPDELPGFEDLNFGTEAAQQLEDEEELSESFELPTFDDFSTSEAEPEEEPLPEEEFVSEFKAAEESILEEEPGAEAEPTAYQLIAPGDPLPEPEAEDGVFPEEEWLPPAAASAAEERAEASADEPEEAGGEVVTETIAELYSSQGLHERAADVYRTLLRQRPGDAVLEARLREAEAAAHAPPATRPEEAGPAEVVGQAPWGEAVAAGIAEPTRTPTAPEAIQPVQPSTEPDPDAEGWLAAGAGTAASAPTPYAWEEDQTAEQAEAGPPIRDYFRGLLSWKPTAPAVPAAVEPPPAEPAAVAPSLPADQADPLQMLEQQPPPASEPEPWEPPTAEPEAWEPVLAAPEAWDPPPAAPAAPPLTAATVVEPEPMPWEEPAASAPEPQAGSSATTSEAAFDAWFASGEPEAATPEPAAPEANAAPAGPEGEAGGEDDDDLEMFRSWLQSLKK